MATMRSTLLFLIQFALLFTSLTLSAARGIASRQEGPRPRTWTDQVDYDEYSLIIKGQRVFLHSGEFMTYRLPVPDLWPDILEKFKAAGFNGLSLYTHMGSINPSRGVVDFESYRALKPLFEAAKEFGVWVVLRPGPYINAETSAGGLAHWTTTEVKGKLRSNASDYREAWTPYILGIIREAVDYQITQGGPIIAVQVDNEYGQDPGAGYFEDLKAVYRNESNGIVVPLTYNDPGMGRSFINGTGAVDLYGFDAYPNRYDCAHPNIWRPVPENYHEYHMEANRWQPLYIPEYQGGSLQAWGPNTPDYSGCAALTGPDFESVFYKQLWADNVKLVNYYPLYGGTSWGSIPFHGVYTSYDWGAAISEPRILTTKYTELKLQGTFLRSSPEFYKTDVVANSTEIPIIDTLNSSSLGFATLLRNPDTGAGFWIVRHNDSTSTAISEFKLNVTTASGASLQIPNIARAITLDGRQSKALVTDYAFGSSRALYSTAEVFFAGVIDGRDVLFLHGYSNQEHEVVLSLTGTNTANATSEFIIYTPEPALADLAPNSTLVSFRKGIQGLHTLHASDTQLVVFADTSTAETFWAPSIASNTSEHASFWGIGTNQSVLVGGPYLVRSAHIEGDTLALRGDLNASNVKKESRLMIIAPRSITKVTWNEGIVLLDDSSVDDGYITGTIELAEKAEITVPELDGWKYHDSLPEIGDEFDDSQWVVANHTETNVPFKMWYGDGRVLYGCDYGYCEGAVVWRGHFNAAGAEKSMNLSINGGQGFAATVWLNDLFLDTSFGNSSNGANNINETDQVFTFPDGSVRLGQDNVVTVVQDNMGLNENWYTDDHMKSPRGIRGFQLNSGNFSEWKVQGKIGGYTNFPDKVRGVMNEGGLFGERKGWHLPDFDTSSWENRSLSDGLPNAAAGVGFFVTKFILSIPGGYDVPISFNFDEPFGQPYRALLFVNGWNMGKRIGNLGPQAKFPVHEGILNYQGENTVAVALWSMTPNVTVSPTLSLAADGVFNGGVGRIRTNNPAWMQEGRE
ncbi:glycoside hydrolase family 35 protein [Moniliophthora roreri MCA 2997]|uniref:beta-galactosidase n=1 Tax=Moniliophthora roreri (strain MCA 2997) TaxID=1381753 RepID=V2WA71_MONRO|nr:glycoside hydrolase family 35 protein [Moniliophthora roreri MCA 2997]